MTPLAKVVFFAQIHKMIPCNPSYYGKLYVQSAEKHRISTMAAAEKTTLPPIYIREGKKSENCRAY